jgi:hypothetical protein
MLVPQWTRPWSQFKAEQSYEMARHHPSPPWFFFRQWYWKMHSNKPESRLVKRVNTHEGCWYHSRQDYNPSLMLSNHMKCRDVTPLALILFWKMHGKTWICFVKRVNTREGCLYHSQQTSIPR